MTVHFKQDKPDNSNRLDGMKQGVVGKSLPRIEGLAKVTGTAELRYPIPFFGPNWSAAAFFDFGYLGNEFSVDPRAYKYAVGSGVRIKTPVGYVRVDLAYKLNPGRRDVLDPTEFLEGESANFRDRFRIHLNFGPWI